MKQSLRHPIAACRAVSARIKTAKKQFKRRLFLLKAKLLLLLVLPSALLVLAAAAISLLLRSGLRRAPGQKDGRPEDAPATPPPVLPAEQTVFRPQFITPEPAETETISS